MRSPLWLDDVEDHDYEAACHYLSLRFDDKRADLYVTHLKAVVVEQRRANDILRACLLKPLPLEDPGVKKNMAKIKKGKRMSPVLVVSFDDHGDIADGYHRVSAAYHISPYDMVPLRRAFAPAE